MYRELSEPLMIREKPEDPSTLIYSHRNLAENPHIHLTMLKGKLSPLLTLKIWKDGLVITAFMLAQEDGIHCPIV